MTLSFTSPIRNQSKIWTQIYMKFSSVKMLVDFRFMQQIITQFFALDHTYTQVLGYQSGTDFLSQSVTKQGYQWYISLSISDLEN
jgi:hypothetical protein